MPVEALVIVEDCPALMVVGEAEIETVGAGLPAAATVTVTVFTEVSPVCAVGPA